MRNAKWFTVSLVIFSCLLVGLGVFSLWPNGGLIEKAFGQRNPRVFVIGNPADLPDSVRANLPPGYSSSDALTPGDVGPIDPLDPDETKALFVVNPTIPDEDIKTQLEWARAHGKTEVYFWIQALTGDYEYGDGPENIPPLDEPNFEGEWSKAIPSFFDFLIEFAYAHSYNGPNCGSGSYDFPSGFCSGANFTDDYGPDGKTPKVTICFHYPTRLCHFVPATDHIFLNIARSPGNDNQEDTSSKKSMVSCMKDHNGSGFMVAPTNLVVGMYESSSALKAAVGECGGGHVCGCTTTSDSTSNPRTSSDNFYALNATMTCPFRGTVRHELMHTYGYSETEIVNQNKDNTNHCQGNHWLHNYD